MTYLREFPNLPAGYINTTDPDLVIESCRLDELSTVAVPLGYGLVVTGITNTNMPTVKLPSAGTDKFYGILLVNNTAYRAPNQTPFTEMGQNLVLVARKVLNVRVVTSTAVAINDPVFLQFSGAGNIGKFRNNNTGTVGIAVPNASWKSTLASAGVAELELRLG